MPVCAKCSEELGAAKESAMCAECKQSFHPSCTRIGTVEAYKKMSSKNKWKCDECKDETSSSASRSDVGYTDTKSTSILESIDSLRKVMCSNFAQVNDNVAEVKGQLGAVNTAIESVKVSIDTLKQENAARKSENEANSKEIQNLKEEIVELREQVLDMQQYTRRNNIEIVGVPLREDENIYGILRDIAAAIDVPYKREDISIAHRLPVPRRVADRPRMHPAIIVSFTSRSVKEVWRGAAKKHKKLTAADLADDFPSTWVFINDHLTSHNKVLLGRAKKLVKEKKLCYAWTSDCKVLVRKSENGPVTRLVNLEDLDKVLATK